MSIVGPRPLALPEEVDRFISRGSGGVCACVRGSLACGPSPDATRSTSNAWMRLDISYIENWSLGLDWSIILKTIPHVIAGRGAH